MVKLRFSALLCLAVLATVTGASGASADLATPTSTTARHVDRHPAAAALLVGIRTGRHTTFDRLVFDLRGAAPGYDVRYVSGVRYDPSWKPVSMMGRSYLQVVLKPASGYDLSGRRTYTGANRVTVGYPTLRGYVVNGDFEAVLSVALGLSKRAGFRVFTLSNPTRIVVDVAH